MEHKVLNQEGESKGAFYIESNGKRVAEMTYSKAGSDRIIIDHTDVDDSLRGQGVGVKLVEFAVNFARNKGIKILPLCPFAKATLSRHPEWKDVL